MYQPNAPCPPEETLPTMYDLPSEDPQEPGLPDEFHDIQPQLLKETFSPATYDLDQVFIGTDLNVYYDVRHPQWYKRPDWFVALGVASSQNQQDLRLSYVVWQEGVAPFLVVELLSPGTEDEDLGQTLRDADKPPTKWNVYERILHVPYYAIFSRYTGNLRLFEIRGVRYQELSLDDNRFWLPEIELGLGVWQGGYAGIEGNWLRWYDRTGNWLPTLQEQAEQERNQVEQERNRAEQERNRAEQERNRAEQERNRAEQERNRAEQERNRAEQAERELTAERSRSQQLAERLRSLGIDLDEPE